ncbi:tetratricopeptide repeat protein (macronuclear) [Tetrahymena thermophila SB210]|uniref:Tetratricopeptide repeat protein n=1 Tax=Tetrahymena thermophila (strain SB210) TaxID=312017 RepID=I7MJ85_TETTS|nr:tetratricopeptide repeat protein [Tetrahymena thermophila SB210]EAR96067.1 tetratricopeptide repeat protein [Tetrahymena thermophila SB210]|eukprot:XP_001016312.1 tetratricopeptide repeat protein [Tetrahymena thermophila SB210]
MQELFSCLKQNLGLIVLQEKADRINREDILFVQNENQEEYVMRIFNLQSDDDQSKICDQKLNQAQNFAKLLQECNHENIPKYIDQFQIKQFYLILMESFDTTLFNWSQQVENFYYIKNDLFIKFSQELFSIVEYIHSKNYLLQNLTLQNIYIDKNMKLKILDFGEGQSIIPSIETKKFLAQQPGNEYIYLPPEFFDYSKKHDQKNEQVKWTQCADIWMLGICLYALAGADLFQIQQFTQGKDFFQYNLNKVDLELRKFVMNILCFNTNQRPQASQLIERLSNINLNQINERKYQIQLNKILNQELITQIQEGKKCLHNKQYEEALQKFNQVIEKNSEDYEVLNLIAQIYLQKNQFEQAEIILNQALKINPENALSLKLLGDVMNGNQQETLDQINHYERCIKNHPEYGELYYNLGSIQQIPLEESIYYLETFSKKYPQSNMGLKKLGMIYATQKKEQKALNQFKKAIALNPFDFECQNLIGKINYVLQNKDQAINDFNLSLTINPDQAEPYYYKGFLEPNRSQYISYFKKACLIDPNYYEAFEQIGNELNFDQKFLSAIQYYKKTIQIKPNIINPYYTLAYIYRTQILRPDKALKVFKKLQQQLHSEDDFLIQQLKYAKMDA